MHQSDLPPVSQLKIVEFKSFHFLAGLIFLIAFLSDHQAKAQLVAGEYAEITVGTDSHIGSPNNGCYDYEHHFSLLNPYIFGMDLYVVIDSIQGVSDSIGIWKYPLYQQTPVYEGDYIQIYDGYSSNDLLYYFYDNDTVYFSFRAIGTPLVAGQSYDCALNMSVGLVNDGCNNMMRSWYAGPPDCVVLDGDIGINNTSCDEASSLEPGMNWVYNFGVNTNDDLNLDCWNGGEGGDVQNGVWYTFTTPDVPVELNLETGSSNCDTVELTGAQIALFNSCSSDPLFCSSPDSGGFGQLEFGCGDLPPNTTYYLLVDSYDGQEGICNLSYQLIYSCQDLGCLDPEACNFDPEADIDDGTCLYGSDCDPEFTISVDTLDCLNYILEVEPYSIFGSGGMWIDAYGNATNWGNEFLFQPTTYGDHMICYAGDIGGFLTMTCVEIYVDSMCFIQPCANEIISGSDSAGCMLSLGLFPTPPENANYSWDLGNGSTSNIGPLIEAEYEESGIYEVCVDITSANCNNIQICDSIVIWNCPVTEPLPGCTDTDACNYDPEATVDDGLCYYGDDCIPEFILTIDTVDCSSFNISASPYQNFFPGVWYVNGVETDSSETLHLNVNEAGIYEICYDGIIFGLTESITCIQIQVDSICFMPCFSEVLINVDSTGCELSFEITSPVPSDAEIGWQYGEGAPIDWSDLPYGSNTYENDGNYILVAIMHSLQCENESIFIPLNISCSLDDIIGCTDPDALNFIPEANVDNGSCIYDPNCLISFEVHPDSIDLGNLNIVPSFDPLDATEIVWSFGDGSESSDPFPSHDYADEGPYMLCCTATFSTADSLECTSEYCLEISGYLTGNGGGPFSLKLPDPNIVSTSGSNRSKTELILWPNPNTVGKLNWKLDNQSAAPMRLDIFAPNGLHLHGEEFAVSAKLGSGILNTSLLAKGLYIVVVETEVDIFRSTFIVQ